MKTDEQLRQDVLTELQWEPSIDAKRIIVDVEEGNVFLRGQVSHGTEKADAERVALRVSGVRSVTVELCVNLSGCDVAQQPGRDESAAGAGCRESG